MSERVAVFFYGLFMDRSLLATRGIAPSSATVGHVVGYRLWIGDRATLLPEEGGRAYGVLMTVRAEEARALYAEESVADYVPETVSVVLPDGRVEAAHCYNLPRSKLSGANAAYASSLGTLARKLGFPNSYVREITRQGSRGRKGAPGDARGR